MTDRYAQTVAFVVAGVGLAAAFLDWAPAPALAAQVAGGFAGVAVLAFAARRHGSGPEWLDVAGTAAAVGFTLTVAGAVLTVSGALPNALLVALFAGIAAVGAGAAAVLGVDRDGVRARERRTFVAIAAALAALLFGGLLAGAAVAFVPDDPLVRVPVRTAVASLGYGVAGFAFVRSFDGGVDVSVPDRRDWLVAAGGVLAIFALHVVLNAIVVVFSLPQSTHGLVTTARQHPGILPPLVLVALLFIAPGEELLARNGVQKYLYGAYSRRAAVVAGSLVFAGTHVLAYAGGGAAPGAVLVVLTRVFLVSLVLGVAYERTDDLFAPVAIHGVYDAVQFGLAYLQFA